MNIEDYSKQFRNLLGVPDDLTADEILELIKKERWEPHLFSKEVDGRTLWACQIRKGIFQTVELNEATGQMGQKGSPTAEIAALEGLRKARFEPAIREIWEFISSSAGISEDEVRKTAEQLSSVDASMTLFTCGSDKSQNLASRILQFIKELQPKTVADRQAFLRIIVIPFLTAVVTQGVDACRSKPNDTVVNNCFLQVNVEFNVELQGQHP